MTEAISNFFSEVFKDNVILATIIIAIVPLIELKGAIPFAMSPSFWGENALSMWGAFLYAFLGGVAVTLVLALIFKPIYEAIKDKKFFKSFVEFFTSSARKKSSEIEEDSKNSDAKKKLWIKLFSTFLFVAVPVPGTGVYTGTCLAILLGLNYWQAIISVTLGNFVAGIIITTICAIFPNFTNIIFYIFIALMLAFLIYRIIVHFINKKSQNNTNEKSE